MIYVFGTTILLGTFTGVFYISRKYYNVINNNFIKIFTKKRIKIRTIIDVQTCEEAEHFVRTIDRGGNGDELAERLFSIYKLFKPTEESMQHLSILYDTCHDKGGVKEFSVTLLYGVATDVLCTVFPVTSSFHVRTQSSPCILPNYFNNKINIIRSRSFDSSFNRIKLL